MCHHQVSSTVFQQHKKIAIMITSRDVINTFLSFFLSWSRRRRCISMQYVYLKKYFSCAEFYNISPPSYTHICMHIRACILMMTTTKFARFFFLFCEFLFWHTITYNTQAHRNQHITLHLRFYSFGDRFIFISFAHLAQEKEEHYSQDVDDDDDESEMHIATDFHDIDIRLKSMKLKSHTQFSFTPRRWQRLERSCLCCICGKF